MKMIFTILLASFFFICISGQPTSNETKYLPTVMWHGMGDSCCNPFSLGRIKKLIEERLPGIYVYSIQIGNNIITDTEHGYFGDVNEQIQEACDEIAKDPLLQEGFNSLGFSQGSQFLRAVAQRCPTPATNNLIGLGAQHQGVFGLPTCPEDSSFGSMCEMIRRALNTEAYNPRGLLQRCPSPATRNFVSFGGQHQGVFGLPHCGTIESMVCEYIRKMLDVAAYDEAIQHHLVQAQYWHNPLNEEAYKNYSIFLSDINNEKTVNEDYKNNMLRLANFVMVKFLQDSMVVPVESEWFGFYAPGQDKKVLPLQETTLYTDDRLGLKIMEKSGKLQFLSVDGDHLQFTNEWFLEEIVDKYLATEV